MCEHVARDYFSDKSLFVMNSQNRSSKNVGKYDVNRDILRGKGKKIN